MTNPNTEGAERALIPEDHQILRMEPWLRVLLAACVPVAAAAMLPRTYLLPLLGLSGLLLVTAIVMVVRQDRRKGR